MNQLQTSIVPCLDDDGETYFGLQILIDGQSLIDIVRHAETSMAVAEGAPNMAGAYGWSSISLGAVDDLRSSVATEKKTVLVLDCTCGFPGCWPLRSRLTFTPRQVVWSHFEQRYRSAGSVHHWSYDHLCSFVFERVAYERTLSQAAGEASASWN